MEIVDQADVRMGRVSFGGVTRLVCLEHVRDVAIGEYVLVHVGFALSRIDEAEARIVFDYLAMMNALEDLDAPELEAFGLEASAPGAVP